MFYCTQLIFVDSGHIALFNLFEEYILPLLKKHNGSLIYRIRPTPIGVVETVIGYPYELHIIAFPTEKQYELYRDDEERLRYLLQKETAIQKCLLMEGIEVVKA